MPAALVGAALGVSIALVAVGIVVHIAGGLRWPGALAVVAIGTGSAAAALLARPAVGTWRRAGLLGVGASVAVAVVALLASPARPEWTSPPPDIATDARAAGLTPVLMLDSSEADRPWLVAIRVTERGGATAIDYWWAFADNRSPTLREAIPCLPRLALARRTCFDHDGDLEGVTVILRGGRPEALHLAIHAGVYRVPWSSVELDAGGRPRVYVARGSHASYTAACRDRCRRPDRAFGRAIPEGRHDGALRVGRLPTAAPPLRPRAQCLLPGLCVRGDPPAPHTSQRRALSPFAHDGQLPDR